MDGKTCETCEWYEDGLCDRLGFLVHDDDWCEKHENKEYKKETG